MFRIKASDLFVKPKKQKRRVYALIGLIMSGIFSGLFIFVTIYGQYTGNYLVTITKEAKTKGIAISESMNFDKKEAILRIQPLNNTLDSLDNFPIETIENTNGQYFEENRKEQRYIAYTFYLKNIGEEVINLRYNINVIDDYKQLGSGTAFMVRRYQIKDEEPIDLYHNVYSKAITKQNQIADEVMELFKPGEIYRFSLIVWLSGEGEIETSPDMLGGAIKFEWVFRILDAA